MMKPKKHACKNALVKYNLSKWNITIKVGRCSSKLIHYVCIALFTLYRDCKGYNSNHLGQEDTNLSESLKMRLPSFNCDTWLFKALHFTYSAAKNYCPFRFWFMDIYCEE